MFLEGRGDLCKNETSLFQIIGEITHTLFYNGIKKIAYDYPCCIMWLYILYIYFTFAISLFRLVPFLSPKNKVKYLFYALFKIGLEGKYLIFVLSDLVFLVILKVYADQIYSYFTFLPLLQKNNNFSSGTISSGLLSCLLYICSYYFCCHYLLLLSTVAPLKKLLVSLFLSSTLPPFLFLFLSPPHPTLTRFLPPPLLFLCCCFLLPLSLPHLFLISLHLSSFPPLLLPSLFHHWLWMKLRLIRF